MVWRSIFDHGEFFFLFEFNVRDVSESLVLQNASQRASQHVKRISGARVMIIVGRSRDRSLGRSRKVLCAKYLAQSTLRKVLCARYFAQRPLRKVLSLALKSAWLPGFEICPVRTPFLALQFAWLPGFDNFPVGGCFAVVLSRLFPGS